MCGCKGREMRCSAKIGESFLFHYFFLYLGFSDIFLYLF